MSGYIGFAAVTDRHNLALDAGYGSQVRANEAAAKKVSAVLKTGPNSPEVATLRASIAQRRRAISTGKVPVEYMSFAKQELEKEEAKLKALSIVTDADQPRDADGKFGSGGGSSSSSDDPKTMSKAAIKREVDSLLKIEQAGTKLTPAQRGRMDNLVRAHNQRDWAAESKKLDKKLEKK